MKSSLTGLALALLLTGSLAACTSARPPSDGTVSSSASARGGASTAPGAGTGAATGDATPGPSAAPGASGAPSTSSTPDAFGAAGSPGSTPAPAAGAGSGAPGPAPAAPAPVPAPAGLDLAGTSWAGAADTGAPVTAAFSADGTFTYSLAGTSGGPGGTGWSLSGSTVTMTIGGGLASLSGVIDEAGTSMTGSGTAAGRDFTFSLTRQ